MQTHDYFKLMLDLTAIIIVMQTHGYFKLMLDLTAI